MRVALYSGTFKPDHDGVARSLHYLVRSLQRQSVRVRVWSPIHSPQDDADFEKADVPSVPIFFYPEYHFGVPWGLTRAIDRFAPDVVHVATPDLVGLAMACLARRKGIPAVASYQTDFPTYLRFYGLAALEPLLWSYLRWFYGLFDRIYVPTDTIHRRLQGKGWRGLYRWPRGVDRERFHPRFRCTRWRHETGLEGKHVILYCGRLVAYKNLDVVVDVCHRLRQSFGERVAFLFVGRGPASARLMGQLPDAVFTGHLAKESLSTAFASSDILLFPSTTETFGNVVLEAMASGIPAVVSDRGGCQDLVGQAGAGIVCRAGDGDSFHRAVQHLLADPTRYRAHCRKALEYARRQDWEQINQRVLDGYVELTRGGGRGSAACDCSM